MNELIALLLLLLAGIFSIFIIMYIFPNKSK